MGKVILTTLLKLNTNSSILRSVTRIRTMSTTYSSEGVEHDHSACQFRLDLTANQTDTQAKDYGILDYDVVKESGGKTTVYDLHHTEVPPRPYIGPMIQLQ